jgi:RNA polymerase sigma factor (sigma-70 family)
MMDEGEFEIWKRCRRGDEKAREQLILSNLRLVDYWVKQISRSVGWVNREDLMQEGVRGLIEAVDRFDVNRGRSFEAYARESIRGAIFRNSEFSRDLPRCQGELNRKVRAVHDGLMQKLERPPTMDEIAKESGLTVKQVMNAIDAVAIAFAGEFPETDLPSKTPGDSVQRRDRSILIREAMSRLGKREALILTEYYWDDQSNVEIANKLGLKEDSVRKIRQRAIIKLRRLLGG